MSAPVRIRRIALVTVIAVGLTAAIGAVVAVVASRQPPGPPPGPPPAAGFYLRDGRLYDANHHDFVMRGVGHVHSRYPEQTPGVLAAAKSMGANTVRLELSTGALARRSDPGDLAQVVSQCRQHRLICVLTAWDTTGWADRHGAIHQGEAVDYWLSVRQALVGQEKYVIVNIANEPYGLEKIDTWRQDTVESIRRLREGGFRHTLMVDAPDWGQDRSFTMRDNAAAVLRADPQHNTLFSIHMYGAFDQPSKVTDYLDRYVRSQLPVVVGEFSFAHLDGDVPEDTVMSAAQQRGIGYLGWSWSGNGGDVSYLDMVTDFEPEALTRWGKRIFHGPDGIAHTSQEASVYR